MSDFEITDPQAMRALAHPVRLSILTHLQRHGPATATQLSAAVGASPSVTSWHLRHLATFGLVADTDGGTDRRQRWWQAAATGFRFEVPETEEGQAAYRMLTEQMMATYDALPRRWFLEVEPTLAPDWRTQSGMANTRLTVTLDELAEIQRQLDELLGSFARRPSSEAPPGSRGVRFLRYTMPETAPEPGSSGHE